MTTFVDAARLLVQAMQFSPGPMFLYGGRVMQWRHHGLGMLQAELSEEVRVHIWHPALVSPGMAWPRCVHDHRFDITSAVVVGEIIDVPCRVQEFPEPFACFARPPHEHRVNIYEIEHAKNQDKMVDMKGCSTASSAKLLNRGILVELEIERQRAGNEYHIDRRQFHTTRVEALAITVIHRSNFDNRLARVLCAPDKDVMAISGIVRDESPERKLIVESVLRQAASAIEAIGPKP